MKMLTVAFLLTVSATSFAQTVGEGVKAGCNPSEWSCDTKCQEKKAAECGLVLSDLKTDERSEPSKKPAAGGANGKAQGQ